MFLLLLFKAALSFAALIRVLCCYAGIILFYFFYFCSSLKHLGQSVAVMKCAV